MDQAHITELLEAYGGGDREALDRLLPAVYDDLKRIAHRQLVAEGPRRPFDTTGLVHEAYLRLVDVRSTPVTSRAHFMSIAARAMRRVLTDEARRRNALKRGGGQPLVTLHSDALGREDRTNDLVALDEALTKLASLDERQGRVVECRLYGGMTYPEIAEALRVSVATVKRDWSLARAWLNRELSE